VPNGWAGRKDEIAIHRDFPNGTNVEMVRILNEHEIELRIWERGVGETLSSGTGSSASAVAAIHAGDWLVKMLVISLVVSLWR